MEGSEEVACQSLRLEGAHLLQNGGGGGSVSDERRAGESVV